jgi:hypothetical protein
MEIWRLIIVQECITGAIFGLGKRTALSDQAFHKLYPWQLNPEDPLGMVTVSVAAAKKSNSLPFQIWSCALYMLDQCLTSRCCGQTTDS